MSRGIEISITPYSKEQAAEWDELVRKAPMATFLHSRRFMSHHGERFEDRSLVFRNGVSKLVGILPAAVDPVEPSRVVSHPGLTYGGLVHAGGLHGTSMLAAIDAIRSHYLAEGFGSLHYKAVPAIYHRRPSDDDLYALTRSGAVVARCDLSCAIDLHDRGRRSERRRRGERKAEKQGVEIRFASSQVEELWVILEENLARRHGVGPTHNAQQVSQLLSLHPEAIEVVTAHLGKEVVAGVVLFLSPRVVHTQYVASNDAGRNAAALDLVMERCIARAAAEDFRYFDFGISTINEGRHLNDDLHRFKLEFGGGGIVYELYELGLER